MPKVSLLFFLLISFVHLSAQTPELRSACKELDQLNTAIINGSVNKQQAAVKFNQLILSIKNTGAISGNDTWVFPLAGYHANAIGGTHGNGYSDKGYKYLDGNKHLAHPAHDIFITDRNQDGLDDRTLKPVNVLAVTDGIVIACTNEWPTASALRGGKYIWIYHPQLNMLTYYAHNKAIFVEPGDVVKQGQRIAEVGRTGYNAYKKRSPTHLHFSAFHFINGLPAPFNCYQNLVKAQAL
ncbi:M23 family metallopeptidase [Mucilaginibacter jinjuensis]|uniref:M23 family metallopeptidase n=1 Tax=Mucilaginibacter jinjuensis TaxID=1176721 RepID=A0ABY7T900_9SPHI|nr:M23 family metallopeptidase [Mucilaginibacter jinjuensis]WCT12901.1 M23 family metallopeptidase [Mucilaginibacter jinjuensis]